MELEGTSGRIKRKKEKEILSSYYTYTAFGETPEKR